MVPFLGREKEINELKKLYSSDGFKMAVLYGRRRIGKTTLINEFLKSINCKVISFVSVERDENELLQMMESSVFSALSPQNLGKLHFESFDEVFDFVALQAQKERIIFFIDEYPYLAKQCPYMNSLLQKYVDSKWNKTQLFFILCGSYVSFMKDEVLSSNAPLYGRADMVFKLRPFDYKEAALFVPNYTPEEKAIVYGVTNGIAKYLTQFDSTKSLKENLIRNFFDSNALITEEQVKTAIIGGRGNPSSFNSIISAIANGKTKFNDICSSTKIEDATYYMRLLCNSELLEKRFGKKPYYILNDTMISFWFKYVSKGASLINAGQGQLYYENMVEDSLHEFMGPVFEKMAKEYIFANMGKLGLFVTDIEEYQTSFKNEKGSIQSVEIDLLGKKGDEVVFAGECKFRNKQFDKEDYEHFIEKVSSLEDKPHIILFSLAGFSDYVKQQDAILVSGEDLY